LYWIPLGAGAHAARISGKVFEAVAARVQHREPCDLYHSALEIATDAGRWIVEQTPVPNGSAGDRGVVASGPVGLKAAGRLRVFRYEIRRWQGGAIPDVQYAVASPVRLSNDPAIAQRLLGLLPSIPTPIWGRDELRTGEMWNSNSVISWALALGGIDVAEIHPPPGGRAPGWGAGVVVAQRARGVK
jgi:hypothetical protein